MSNKLQNQIPRPTEAQEQEALFRWAEKGRTRSLLARALREISRTLHRDEAKRRKTELATAQLAQQS